MKLLNRLDPIVEESSAEEGEDANEMIAKHRNLLRCPFTSSDCVFQWVIPGTLAKTAAMLGCGR